MLPFPLMLRALQLVIEANARESQTAAVVRRAELQAHIRELEIAADISRVTAHRDIILAMIKAAKCVEEKKIDAYNMAFIALKNHALKRLNKIDEDTKDIRGAMLREERPDERIALRIEISDLKHERLALNFFLLEAQRQHNLRVEAIKLEVGPANMSVNRISSTK